MKFDLAQFAYLAPLLTVIGGGVLLLLLEAFIDGKQRGFLMPLTLVVCGLAALFTLPGLGEAAVAHDLFHGLIHVDRMSSFASLLFLVAAALTALVAAPYMHEHRFEFGELYPLLLFATSGMMILAAATDLLTVFLGIEIMSIAVYVLSGSWRRNARSSEAAMKYYLNGAFTTAILLYGMALVYGATGTTSLDGIAQVGIRVSGEPLFILGMLLIAVGVCFKIAAVPFHMWAPDAYEGAPTPITGFMAAGIKAAAFVALLRLFGVAFARQELIRGATGWATLLSVLAIATMTLGNLLALGQENVKRLLAYSSIAHAGYLLVGIVAMGSAGLSIQGPVLFYLAAYSFTTIGTFAVVAWVGSRDNERLKIDDWAGLGQRHPAAALVMTLFLLSLGGVPPTAGFFAKLYLFRAAVAEPHLTVLVVAAVLNSVISVAYYLRIVTTMYFREPHGEVQPLSSRSLHTALILSAAATLLFGLAPNALLNAAAQFFNR